MSGITLKKTDPTDVPTPATDKATIFLDDGSGEPSYKDDAAVVHTLVGTPGAAGADGVLTYLDHGNTGSTETVTVSAGDVQRLVANAATVTLTLAGWPSAGTPGICRLLLTQDGTGGRDWAFPVAVDFGAAGEPDWTASGSGDVDIVDLTSVDGGTTVIASVAGRAGAAGAAGSNGTNGTNGTTGGAVTIPYTFSTTTTDSDPGSGNLRLSNATQTSATVIRADLLASDGTDWTAVLNTLADASNTVKGHIRLFKTSDPTKWLLFTVSAVATPSGYRNITVANVGGSASSPFANADAITLTFTRSGDQGSTVGAGTLTTIEEVDGSPTDSAVTKLVFPNGTLGIASHVATYTPAAAAPVAVSCRAHATATQTITAGASTALTFDTEDFDTDGFHSGSGSRFTIPAGKDGKYRCEGGSFSTAVASGKPVYCEIWKNGTVVWRAHKEAVATDSLDTIYAQTTLALVATDYIEIAIFNGDSSNRAFGHASAAHVQSWGCVTLIGS